MSSVAAIPVLNSILELSSVSERRNRLESSLSGRLSSTLWLRSRPAPRTVSTGIAPLDEFTGGLPRGALSEFFGPSSSGRTGVMLAALAAATRRDEVCALVDAGDSFDPSSAAAAGIKLERLLWVRCNEHLSANQRKKVRQNSSVAAPQAGFIFSRTLEQVLKVTDLLLQGGGFGVVALDLGDIPAESMRRIPLTSWFRFRRAVETTATVLLVIAQESCAKTCASLVLQLQPDIIYTSTSSGDVHISQQAELKFSDARKKTAKIAFSSSPAQPRQNQEPTRNQLFRVSRNGASHTGLLRGMGFQAEVIRTWKGQRKPVQSVDARFKLRTVL